MQKTKTKKADLKSAKLLFFFFVTFKRMNAKYLK